MDANTPFTVSVLTGAHTGAVLALPSGLHVFGHDQSADVVLTDAGLASRHFTLDLAIDEVILEALSEGIVIGGKPVEREDVIILGFPVDIAIGDVRLRIEGPAPVLQDELPHPATVGKQGAARSPTTVLAMGLFLLGACVSLYLVTGGFGQAAGAAGIDPGRAGAAAHPGQGAADAARFMTDRLTSAGLGSALTARAEEGAVRVAGTIPPDRQAAWEAAQRAFDQVYGSRVVLHVEAHAAAAGTGPALAPQAVWTGPSPYVVTGSGERVPEGTVLEDGWTVDHILADRIILHRGAQTIALTF